MLENKHYIIYEYIKSFIVKEGYAPSFKEISTALAISTSTVHNRLAELQKQGLLGYQSKIARSIVIRK